MMIDSEGTKIMTYSHQIKELITKLNGQENAEKGSSLLKVIKQKDAQFLSSLNLSCQGHALLTRHGQCNNWGQKKFGLSPNSPLSEDCKIAMAKTHQQTGELFYFDKEIPSIKISPMVRAKQTASFILPQSRKYDISYQTYLTENSSKPASSYITSYDQLIGEYRKTQISKNFTKVLTFKLSSLFYGEETYSELQDISNEAENKLKTLKKQKKEMKLLVNEYNNKNLTQQQKRKLIQLTMKNQFQKQRKDIWFFGHSKNLKYFFKNQFGDKESFVFGETRRIYIVRNQHNQLSYFVPPYKFYIDQSCGKVKASFKSKQKLFFDFS